MANVTENRINTTISAADMATIETALLTIKMVLATYTLPLTDAERISLATLKVDNLVFAEDALVQSTVVADLLPPALSSITINLANDIAIFKQLDKLEKTFIEQFTTRIKDTKRVAGNESYTAALTIFKIIEALHESGVQGATGAYNVLKERFKEQGGGNAGGVQPNP